jgi:hypothetical protein
VRRFRRSGHGRVPRRHTHGGRFIEFEFEFMKSRMVSFLLRASVCIVAAAAMSGCASLHPQPNGPGDCVGPPDYCVPYFGGS